MHRDVATRTWILTHASWHTTCDNHNLLNLCDNRDSKFSSLPLQTRGEGESGRNITSINLLTIHSNLTSVDIFGIFDPNLEVMLAKNINYGLYAIFNIFNLPLVGFANLYHLYRNQINLHDHALDQLTKPSGHASKIRACFHKSH